MEIKVPKPDEIRSEISKHREHIEILKKALRLSTSIYGSEQKRPKECSADLRGK